MEAFSFAVYTALVITILFLSSPIIAALLFWRLTKKYNSFDNSAKIVLSISAIAWFVAGTFSFYVGQSRDIDILDIAVISTLSFYLSFLVGLFVRKFVVK